MTLKLRKDINNILHAPNSEKEPEVTENNKREKEK